jgi:hypothetical protein
MVDDPSLIQDAKLAMVEAWREAQASLEQAAKDCGYRVTRVRRLANLPAFRDYLAALEARRAADGR